LLDVEDGFVRFRYKDYAHGHRKRLMRLPALEFVRRLLLHVLPRGFVRIRHYGLLSNRQRREDLALCRQLLEGVAAAAEREEPGQQPKALAPVTPARSCPNCGATRMMVIEEFPPLSAAKIECSARPGVCVFLDSS
jgi:hypothetical protein